MPNDNPSRPPSAQPWSPPEPGALLNMMLEVPETLLLLWQQVLAGAPSPGASWGTKWQQTLFQGQAPADRSGPPPPPSSPPHVEMLDFWMRALRSFRSGLAAPHKER